MGGRPGAFLFALLCASLALADGAPSNNPNAQYGAMTLAAATATTIPAAPLPGRYAISVQNLDTAAIYCGWDNAVTANNGTQVPANGQVTFSVSYDYGLGRAALYCISVAGTASNAIRWMEVR